MKKTVIINLSPRQKGTSYVLADLCQQYLLEHGHQVNYLNLYTNSDKMENIFHSIDQADTIIMSGPSYINCYPADTIALLQGILEHKNILHGQNLYGIIQGGMPYAHTHVSGIRTLELFCVDAGIHFKGGYVLGMGAMLNGQSLDNLLNAKSAKRQFNIFMEHIEKGEVSPNSVYEKAIMKPPAIVSKIMASRMNKKIDKDLLKRGIDINQGSPYLKS